jgi:hypothetical protein
MAKLAQIGDAAHFRGHTEWSMDLLELRPDPKRWRRRPLSNASKNGPFWCRMRELWPKQWRRVCWIRGWRGSWVGNELQLGEDHNVGVSSMAMSSSVGKHGGIYTFPLALTSLLLPQRFIRLRTDQCSSLSPPLAHLELPSNSIDFTINPWEKMCQNLIREQFYWFPKFKEHLVHVLAGGCVCYSWSFAPSRRERRPMSLPSLW